MQKILKITLAAVKAFDFFPNRQFIRYQYENEYKTATGGTISLGIIIFFIILFLNNGLKVVRKQLITSSYSTQYDSNPSSVDIKFSDKSFMFTVAIPGINITDPSITWFEINAYQVILNTTSVIYNITNIPLVPCTDQHFSVSQGILQDFSRFTNYSTLCPSLDYCVHLQGKLSSSIYSYLDIVVKKCNSTLQNNCAPQSLIQQVQSMIGQWTLYIPFVVPVINPSSSDYKTYVIQDRNYFSFSTKTFGVNARGYYEGYTVDTDQSIFPYQSHIIQTGGYVSSNFIQQQHPILNTTIDYIDLKISKSPVQTNYSRSFQKLDTYLSYVGGLIGILLIFFFIFNIYTETAYSLSLASKIFTYNQKEVQFQRFNFLYFVLIKMMKLMKYLRCKCSWDIVDQFMSCKEEIEKQVDITFILKRIKYLENVVSVVLQQHEQQALHLSQKEELSKAIYNRKLYQKQKDIQEISAVKSINQVADKNQDQLEPKQTSLGLRVTFKAQAQKQKYEIPPDDSLSNPSLKMSKNSKSEKMAYNLEKIVQQVRNGDPISSKVAQKIGLKVQDVRSIKKVQTRVFQFGITNYDGSENSSI